MSVARSQLIGKKVYNPDGELVGEVYDVGFAIGEAKVYLMVKSKRGGELSIEWDNVAAAKDIIILKEAVEIPAGPAVAPAVEAAAEAAAPQAAAPQATVAAPAAPQAAGEGVICPYCGKPATWIEQYKRWYCYNCGRYVEGAAGAEEAGEGEAKVCPYCGKPATWIEQYKRWYCYNCGRYIE